MVVAVKDIYNLALSSLGTRSRVTATDDGSKEANALNVVYEDVRDELLAEHPWNFATMREVLATQAVATAPDEWTYVYVYPSDCLAVRYLCLMGTPPDTYAGARPIPYAVRTVKDATTPTSVKKLAILTDLADAVACYTWQVTDPNFMRPNFRRALGWKLAAAVALNLTGSRDAVNGCLAMYRTQFDLATMIDAREGLGHAHDEPAPWDAARG